MSDLTVQFGEGRGIVVPLEIRGPDEAISIEHLYALLFALRVQVLSADEHADADGIVQRLLVCEFDGGPLRLQRRKAIAEKMTAALTTASRRSEQLTGPGVASAAPASETEHGRHAA